MLGDRIRIYNIQIYSSLSLSLSLSLFVFFTDNLFLYILTFLCLTYWLAQSITIIPLPRYNFLYLHNPCHFGTNTNSFSLSLLNSLPSSLLLLSLSLKFIFSFSTKSLSFYHTRCPTLSGLLFTLPSLINSILLQQFFSLSISHTLYCSFTPFLSLSLPLLHINVLYTFTHFFNLHTIPFSQTLFLAQFNQAIVIWHTDMYKGTDLPMYTSITLLYGC